MAEPAVANVARRDAILEAAAGVFSRYGFRKTSMDDIARAAGLSRQGLYLHFPTKETLFEETVLAVIAAIRVAGRAALARTDLTPDERLLAAFEAVHAHAIGQPGAENTSELLEAAVAHAGPAVDALEQGIVADVARVLRSSGVADGWKDAGISAKELALHLHATSYGLKHRVSTAAEYRDGMRVAVQIACHGSTAPRARRGR